MERAVPENHCMCRASGGMLFLCASICFGEEANKVISVMLYFYIVRVFNNPLGSRRREGGGGVYGMMERAVPKKHCMRRASGGMICMRVELVQRGG